MKLKWIKKEYVIIYTNLQLKPSLHFQVDLNGPFWKIWNPNSYTYDYLQSNNQQGHKNTRCDLPIYKPLKGNMLFSSLEDDEEDLEDGLSLFSSLY